MGERIREALPMLPLYRQLTGTLNVMMDDPTPPQPTVDENQWARDILDWPSHYPDDLTGDLRNDPPKVYDTPSTSSKERGGRPAM